MAPVTHCRDAEAKSINNKNRSNRKNPGGGGGKNEAVFREAFPKSFFNGHFQERLTNITAGQKTIIYAPVTFERIKFIISDISLCRETRAYYLYYNIILYICKFFSTCKIVSIRNNNIQTIRFWDLFFFFFMSAPETGFLVFGKFVW